SIRARGGTSPTPEARTRRSIPEPGRPQVNLSKSHGPTPLVPTRAQSQYVGRRELIDSILSLAELLDGKRMQSAQARAACQNRTPSPYHPPVAPVILLQPKHLTM